MRREDFIFVGVRLFGLYLLVQAIRTFADALTILQNSLAFNGRNESEIITAFFGSAAIATLVRFAIFLAPALYLMLDGKLIYTILSRPFNSMVARSQYNEQSENKL